MITVIYVLVSFTLFTVVILLSSIANKISDEAKQTRKFVREETNRLLRAQFDMESPLTKDENDALWPRILEKSFENSHK